MLVLQRRAGESIIITAPDGTRIEILVETIDYRRVRIAIDAPRTYIVDRDEVDKRKRLQRGEISGNVPRELIRE